MSATGDVRVGSMRPSQLMWNYGIGAMIDLPRLSVMVEGLDRWFRRRVRTSERRHCRRRGSPFLGSPRADRGDFALVRRAIRQSIDDGLCLERYAVLCFDPRTRTGPTACAEIDDGC